MYIFILLKTGYDTKLYITGSNPVLKPYWEIQLKYCMCKLVQSKTLTNKNQYSHLKL